MNLRPRSRLALGLALALVSVPFVNAQPAATSTSTASADAANLANFERRATLAKELGATHVIITDGLPPALWQFDVPDDPYPGWYIMRPDPLKLFPPKEVQPFVDLNYTRRVAAMLEERSKVLRRLGLKAHWAGNIPQVMPEAFFTAYPQLRGARVDQPNRSRAARFSMCVDQPETVRLYAEAIKTLLAHCPEVETFAFATQDSGSGFCWVPSLYPGLNGHSDCKDRPMDERISSFLIALQDAAKQSGHPVEISLHSIPPRQWMIPSFAPETLSAIIHRLPRGIAVNGVEGPDGRTHQAFPSSAYANGAFYPIVGIPLPPMAVRGARGPITSLPAAGDGSRPARLLIRFGAQDAALDFTARYQKATQGKLPRNQIEHLTMLRAFAAGEVGEEDADNLLQAWTSLDQAQRGLGPLNFGDVLQFGHVLNRWMIRPMVPFPEEISAREKSYYRRFLFQAKGEEQADNLIDIQAMRMFDGYGAKMLFQRVIELVVPDVRDALQRFERLRDRAKDDKARAQWKLAATRLEALICLLNSADNMVSYQAQLDRVKSLGVKPEPNPVLGVQSSWDRTDLMETARKEIDNAVRLKRLLESTTEPILDLAPNAEEETVMRLGPDVAAQLKRKIDLMNAHWIDYDRLFTVPNP
jgi:hypothetical protein